MSLTMHPNDPKNPTSAFAAQIDHLALAQARIRDLLHQLEEARSTIASLHKLLEARDKPVIPGTNTPNAGTPS